MLPHDIIFLDKTKAIVNNRDKLLFATGISASSKSFPCGINFLFRIFEAPVNDNLFVMSGKSTNWLIRQLKEQSSFINIFKSICQLKEGANARVEVSTPTGIKSIYLVGYDNKKRWGDVLGLNIKGFLIEEIDTAHLDFIKQTFLRIARFEDAFLICNSNGGDTDNPIFTEFLDRCTPLEGFEDDMPIELSEIIYADRDDKQENWKVIFCGFDDNPTLTEQAIRDMKSVYPINSHHYNIYIRGVRGVAEGLIYNDAIDEGNDISYTEAITTRYKRFTIGVDVGATDLFVFTLLGQTMNNEIIAIDKTEITNAGTDEIFKHFCKWWEANEYTKIPVNKILGFMWDSSAKITRLSLEDKLKIKYGIDSVGAYKYTIKERVDLGIAMLNLNKLKFTERTRETKMAFKKVKYVEDWFKKKITDFRLFMNHDWKDRIDSLEYAWSPITIELSEYLIR